MRAVSAAARSVPSLAVFVVLASFGARGADAQTPDADALIASLALTPPASVAFAEARFSSLLVQPIVVSGKLEYPAPRRLERGVSAPYSERASIDGDAVTVTRAGEAPKTLSLRRAPELRGLSDGLGALLAGDAAALRASFGLTTGGSAEAWTLSLAPRERGVEKRLVELVASGARAELRCFELRDARGGTTLTLLGARAAAPIAADVTLEELRARCQAE
jgi:hypothetical protein